MAKIGDLTQDGFKGSIELLRFLKDMNSDLINAIVALIGESIIFIKGGEISELSGNTTIADGIIVKDGNIHQFKGGTYPGSPSTLSVLFETLTKENYPMPYFSNDPIPKDIYLADVARIDATGTIVLNTIGYLQNMESIKADLEALNTTVTDHSAILPTKADKFGFDELSGAYYNTDKLWDVNNFSVIRYHSGLIRLTISFKSLTMTTHSDWLLRGLPKSLNLVGDKRDIGIFTDPSNGLYGLYKSLIFEDDPLDSTKYQLRLIYGIMPTNSELFIDIIY